jgi:hypothetical protein
VKAGFRFNLTLKSHVQLIAEDMLRGVIQWIARPQNARQSQELEGMSNQPSAERRRITAAVMSLRKNPSEFDVLDVEISARAKSREADDFVGRFQADGPVAKLIARPEMPGDE